MIAPSCEHYHKFKMQRTNTSSANIINHREKEDSISFSIEGVVLSVALFIISFSGLAFEVSLTRLYSVIFLQGYVYLLISLSMAGLGIGAVLVYYLTEKSLGLLFHLLVFFPLLTLALIIGVNYLTTQFTFSLIPVLLLFACIGASTTFLLQRSTISISFLYFVDLCGASAGALASFFLLNAFGAVKVIMLLAMLMSLSIGLIIYHYFKLKRMGLIGYLVLVTLSIPLLFLDLTSLVSPQYNRLKDMSRVMAEQGKAPKIVETRWTAFGRLDLVETNNPLSKTLYIDGAAGTKMIRMENGQLDPAMKRALVYEYVGGIPLLPIPAEQREHAVVIGSGGGIDVVTLLAAKYKKIIAVEINPDFVNIVKSYGAYNGNIYNNHPGVTVVNQEGRTFIRSAHQPFDLIHMSLPIIKSARNIGSFALTENHLFTHEAFREYWNALNPNGYLIIVSHYTGEAYRLVSNIIKALEQQGINTEQAMKHMVLIGPDSTPAVILRKKAFTAADAEIHYGMIRALHQEGSSNFIPYVDQHTIQYQDQITGKVKSKPMLNKLLYQLSKGDIDLDTFIARQTENVSWISDDSPFFYQMKKKAPQEIMVVLTTAIILVVLLAAFFRHSSAGKKQDSSRYFILFGIIGSAFMMIEIAMIQKFILFLGHETLALAYLLSLILLSTGLGSYISGRLGRSKIRLNVYIVLIIFFIGIAYFASSPMQITFESSPILIKTLFSLLLLFPVFFLMGFLFPTFLTQIKAQQQGEQFVPWMIGINSLATLLGGCLAIVIAMLWGYSHVFVTGIILYASILLLMLRWDVR